jgi:hypothetical protein
MEYLKILAFPDCTLIAEICYFEPFQPHTIYGHSPQKKLSFEPQVTRHQINQQHNPNLLEEIMEEFARRWSEKSLRGISIPLWRLLYLGR